MNSRRFSLSFLCALLLAEFALTGIVRLSQTGSLAVWAAAALSVALVTTLIFSRMFFGPSRRLGELVAAVAALGRGDLTVKIPWAAAAPAGEDPELAARTDRLAKDFAGNFTAGFALHPEAPVTVGKISVPALRCGQNTLNLETAIVDRCSNVSGGVATIFAMRGDDMVRIATSLKKPDGSRVVGTMLDRRGPSTRNCCAGRALSGPRNCSARPT